MNGSLPTHMERKKEQRFIIKMSNIWSWCSSFAAYFAIIQSLVVILAHGFLMTPPPSLLPHNGWSTRNNHIQFHRGRNRILQSTASDNLDNNTTVSSSSLLLTELLARFQGDFDNFHQVCSDRSNDLLPREGGGHEHFHVTLIPLPLDILPADSNILFHNNTSSSPRGAVVAAYYFDGMPNRIFRLRMYTLYCDNKSEGVKMKLFTLDPILEGKLRDKSSFSIETWVDLIDQHFSSMNDDDASSSSFQEMERCDILWTEQPDPIRHQYLKEYTRVTEDSPESSSSSFHKSSTTPIHAIMVNDHEKGGVLLESQMMPGFYIRVQDELSLWGGELWINDRGHDAKDSTKMVYGNWNGVPYQMTRVSKLVVSPENSKLLQRTIVDPSLRWTLGERYRTPEEYESKMSLIGGVSTRMNQSTKK